MPQLVEISFGNNQHVGGGASLNGRVTALVGEQCHFSEIVAGGERGEQLWGAIDLLRVFLQHIALAFLDHVDAVAQIALLEHDVAGLEMLILNPRFRL